MKVEVNVIDYDTKHGLVLEWGDDCTAVVQLLNKSILIKANQPALELLAHHLLTLAQDQVSKGHHIHYDDSNFLEPGSCELIIERT
jgi:hypothetical protein